jgi:hypothetical protein
MERYLLGFSWSGAFRKRGVMVIFISLSSVSLKEGSSVEWLVFV